MQLTKRQKTELLGLFKSVNVKEFEIDHTDEELVKWFRFGSHNGLQIAGEIVKAIQEKPTAKTKIDLQGPDANTSDTK